MILAELFRPLIRHRATGYSKVESPVGTGNGGGGIFDIGDTDGGEVTATTPSQQSVKSELGRRRLFTRDFSAGGFGTI